MGILIDSSNENTVKDSFIHQISKYGVQLDDLDGPGGSSNNLIIRNSFFHSQNSVHAFPSDSNWNTVTLNTFTNSDHEQVHWHDNNHNNLAYNNNIIDGPGKGFNDECSGCGNQFFTVANGGNWYSHYDEPSEGCFDLNLDGFCDAPFIGDGNQDDFPWITQNGWVLP